MPCRLKIKTILIRVHVHLGFLVVWIGQKPIKGKTPNIGVTNQKIEVGWILRRLWTCNGLLKWQHYIYHTYKMKNVDSKNMSK